VTVYVDDSLITAKVGRLESQWSHLFADSQTELHAFAERLGLQRDWYQPDKHGGGLWHYDVTARKRLRAIQLGAQPVTWREAVDIMRERDNRPTNRREVAGDAGTADLAAGHAYQAGDLVRAAWLVRDAMDQDTSRAEHWAGRMDRILAAATQRDLGTQTAVRLAAAGIDASDPAMQRVARHNARAMARAGIGTPHHRRGVSSAELSPARTLTVSLTVLRARPGRVGLAPR